MHNVAEKDREGGEHHAQAHAEAHKQQQADRQQNQVPRRHNAEPQHNDGNGDQREGKVNQREEHLLYWEDPAVHLNLLEQRGSTHDRRQGLVRRLGHDGKGHVTHDQVERVHLGRNRAIAALGENRREHDGHDDHHQQRVEHRPCDAQNATAILDLKILGNQLTKDKRVLLKFVLSKRRRQTASFLLLCLIRHGCNSFTRNR